MRLGGQFEIGPTFLFGSGYAGLGISGIDNPIHPSGVSETGHRYPAAKMPPPPRQSSKSGPLGAIVVLGFHVRDSVQGSLELLPVEKLGS